jgi:DM9 repeat
MTKRLLACWFIAVLLSMPVHADWVKAQDGQLPPNAVVAGKTRDGQPLYVCRARYERGVYPGALTGAYRDCSVSYEGKEYSLQDYEVLVGGSFSWIAVFNGEIPFDALPAGREQKGNPLYICRGEINSEWHPGKIRQTYGGCSVPYAGKELTAPWYQVLVGN